MKKILLSIFALISPVLIFSQESTSQKIDTIFKDYTGWFVEAIFYEIPFSDDFRIPWVLIVLIGGALYFTIYFKFINITGFKMQPKPGVFCFNLFIYAVRAKQHEMYAD